MSLGKYTSLGSAWTTFYYRQNVDLTMNDADNLIEIKLICGLKKGSLKAFDAIYDMYAKRLMHIVCNIRNQKKMQKR